MSSRRFKKLIELKTFGKAFSKAAKSFPVDKNKVLFISDVRDNLDGNLMFVFDYLSDSEYKRNVICVDRQKRGLSGSDIDRIAQEMATSGYIFMEDVLSFMNVVTVREGQKYIQLWHAAGAYKKFGFSRLASKGAKVRISSGYKKYTNATVSAEFIREDYAEAFGIDMDKVQAMGVPRTDLFFDDASKAQRLEKLYTDVPQLKDKRIILFAPTYRGTRPAEASYDFSKIDPSIITKMIMGLNTGIEGNDKWLFVVKWHPAMVSNGSSEAFANQIKGMEDAILDLSFIRDVNDLLLAADVLVTDYSSVIFEYFLLEKPIVFYTWDLEEYYHDRSFYYPFEDYAYGQVSDTLDDMLNAAVRSETVMEKRQLFGERFMSACDGRSTQKVCDWVFDKE